MKFAILLSIFIFSQASYALTFKDAEALVSNNATESKAEPKEFKNSQKIAVDSLWHSTSQCFNDHNLDRVQFVLEITNKGRVANVWSDSDSERAICIKQKAKQALFPIPRKSPEYIKVIM